MKHLIAFLMLLISFNMSVLAQAPDYKHNPSFWITGVNTTPVSDPTPIVLITAVPTPTGTSKAQAYYITDFTATNSNATIPTDVQLLDGAVVKYQCGAAIKSRPCTKKFRTPIKWNANTDIIARTLTNSATVRFSVEGYRAPDYPPTPTPTPTPTVTPTPTPQSLGEPPLNFSGLETGDEGETQQVQGTYVIVTSPVHSGHFALEINPVSKDIGAFYFGKQTLVGSPDTGFDVPTLISGFMFRPTLLPVVGDTEFYTLWDVGAITKAVLTTNNLGQITVFDSTLAGLCTTSAGVLNNNWHLIEFLVPTGAATQAILRVDGVVVCTAIGDFGADNAGFGIMGQAGTLASDNINFYYDDMWWSDGVGGINKSIGEQNVVRLIPDSNGVSAQWVNGTGASNYTQVLEAPTDGFTTTVAHNATGSPSTNLVGLQSAATGGITTNVNSVKCWSNHGASPGIDASLMTRMYVSGSSLLTDGEGVEPFVSRFLLSNVSPNTLLPWTHTDIDNLQCGVFEDTGNAVTATESTAAGLVLFDTPP